MRHRAVLLERLGDLGDRRLLLADDDVDADDALALLVDDRVEGDGGLAGLAVADDQLALAAADRDHGVDRLQARLHGLLDALAVDDAGRDALDRVELGRLDRALVVDRAAERVHDAADERRADGHLDDAPRAPDLLAFLDHLRLAEQHDADLVLLEVEGEAEDVVAEVHELARHDLVEAVDARDAVADREHRADLGHVDRLLVAGQLLFQDRGDLVCLDFHSQAPVLSLTCVWNRRIAAATEPSNTRDPARAMNPPSSFGSISICDLHVLAGARGDGVFDRLALGVGQRRRDRHAARAGCSASASFRSRRLLKTSAGLEQPVVAQHDLRGSARRTRRARPGAASAAIALLLASRGTLGASRKARSAGLALNAFAMVWPASRKPTTS